MWCDIQYITNGSTLKPARALKYFHIRDYCLIAADCSKKKQKKKTAQTFALASKIRLVAWLLLVHRLYVEVQTPGRLPHEST